MSMSMKDRAIDIFQDLKPYLPNKSRDMAFINISSGEKAYWPFRAFQIVGTKRWSLSLLVIDTPVRTMPVSKEPDVIPDPYARVQDSKS